MKVLLDHALDLATFFLEGGQLTTFVPVRDGFTPFVVGISPDGEVLDFNCMPSVDSPGRMDVYPLPDQLAMFGDAKEECWPAPFEVGPPVEAFA
jgi:hypothetical protein